MSFTTIEIEFSNDKKVHEKVVFGCEEPAGEGYYYLMQFTSPNRKRRQKFYDTIPETSHALGTDIEKMLFPDHDPDESDYHFSFKVRLNRRPNLRQIAGFIEVHYAALNGKKVDF